MSFPKKQKYLIPGFDFYIEKQFNKIAAYYNHKLSTYIDYCIKGIFETKARKKILE